MTFQAEVTAAQLPAVYTGRKPAFVEPDLRMVRPFAEHLPPGIHYVETGGHGCIYNEAAVARELGIAPGPELHAAVRDAVAGEEFGLLLGYGAPSIFTTPSHTVQIYRNGEYYYRFTSSADENAAEHYARERQKDFEIAFPGEKWEHKLDFYPGSDNIRAAAMDYRDYVGQLTPDATARMASEWAKLEPEARVGKFFLAGIEDERLVVEMHKLVESCLNEGVSEAEFVHRATQMLREQPRLDVDKPYYDPQHRQQMSDEERRAYDKNVSNIDSHARLKLIYRTQSEMAAGYREWQRAQDRLERYPAWRFVRQPGARIKRPDHVAHENEVRLVSDIDYWLARNSPDQGGFNVPYPPFGYNSWMRVQPVSRRECEKLGLLTPGEPLHRPAAWAHYTLPQLVEKSNTASLQSLPQESAIRLRERCQEEGLELRPTQSGSISARPAPIQYGDPELLLDLLELIDILTADDEDTLNAANPYGCNQHQHRCPSKGTTREGRTKGTPHRVHRVDQSLPMHKQVNALADALERAARDGARLEAVIYRPEFGELTLDCGNPGRKNDSKDSRGHGVQHALEERHHVSAREIAHTLLTGKVSVQTGHPSRLRVETERARVVLEREITHGSGRTSRTRAKLHTAMKTP